MWAAYDQDGVTPDGWHLNIAAWVSASQWTSGACDGNSAPEDYYDAFYEVLYSPNGKPPYTVVYYDAELNDYDLWGIYMATVGEAAPFTGVDIPASQLRGTGYYALEVGVSSVIGNDTGNFVMAPWTWVNIPNPPLTILSCQHID